MKTMKGLLLKDFYLTIQKKKFMLIILFVAGFLLYTQREAGIAFVISYVSVLSMELVLSTFTADEFDRSIVCLMTLPVDSSLYVTEKYLFSFLCGLTGCFFTTAVCAALWPSDIRATAVQSAIVFVILVLFQSIVLPIQIKFGSEKGRIALLIMVICGVAIVSLFDRIFVGFLPAIETVINSVAGLHPAVLLTAVIGLALLCILISWTVSRKIMDKKSY